MASGGRFDNIMKSYLSSESTDNSNQTGYSLDKFLRCMICSSYYNDARIFPCGHCACANCLGEHIRSNCKEKHVNCPECDTAIECKSGSATDFPKSNLLSVLSMLQQQQATSANQICEFCKHSEDKIQPARKFCTECAHFLCGTCSDNHNRTMLTRNHTLVDSLRASEHLVHARSRSQMCSDHRDKVADLYCKRCDKVVCQICALVAHRQHQIVDMPSVAGQLKQDLQKLQQDVLKKINTCEKYESNIDEVNKKNQKLHQNLTDHVHKWAEDVKRRVDSVAQKLKEQLKVKADELNDQNRAYAEKAGDRLDLFRGLHECIEELLRVGTANELYHLSADVKSYLQLIEGGPFSTSNMPVLQLLSLNDKLLSNTTFACEAIKTQADNDERDEPSKREDLESANEEQQRLRIVSAVKYRVEPASVSKLWFPARCKQDTQKVQIRSVYYQEEKRTYLVGDIWNRCIKEFNEKGVYQNMWLCRVGWPIALVQSKNKNIICVEYDIGLRQCSLVVYGSKGQVHSTTSLNFSGMYIGSIALTNENHIIVPNHDERKIFLYQESGGSSGGNGSTNGTGNGVAKQKPMQIAINGRPEFVAYVKTSGTTLVTCPQDQLVHMLKGEHVMLTIKPSDLGAKSWRPYCVAASPNDGRFVVQDGFHPDQDRLIVFDEAGSLMRVLPQDRVWIRLFIDSRSRLVLCDKQNVAVYTCSWLQVNEKNATPATRKSAKKSARERCATHPKKTIEVYCQDCDERVCQLCLMLKHNGHSLVDLTARDADRNDANRNERENGDTDSNASQVEVSDVSAADTQSNTRSDPLDALFFSNGNDTQTSVDTIKKQPSVEKDTNTAYRHLVPVKEFPYKWKLYDGEKLVSEFKTHKGEPAAAIVADDKIIAIERISEIQSLAVFYNLDTTVESFVDMKNGLNPSNVVVNDDGNVLVPGGGETAVFLYAKDCSSCLAQHSYDNILPEFIAYSPSSHCVAVSFPSEHDPFVSLTCFSDSKLGGVTMQLNLTSKSLEDGTSDSWTPRALCFVPHTSGETLWVFDETSRRIVQFNTSGKLMCTVAQNVDDCEYLYALGTNKVLLVGRSKIQTINFKA